MATPKISIKKDDPRWSPGSPALQASFDAAVERGEQTMRVPCKKCGVAPADGRSGMCQDCTIERINGAGELEDDADDDLFARCATAPLTDLQHRITCAVCEKPATIFVGAPGDLCNSCRADPVMTRVHVEDVVERARARLHTLIETFEAAVAAENAEDQARWQKVIEARVKGDPAIFQARWAKTLALGDGLARILAAHAPYEAGCAEVERLESWGAKALGELAVCEGGG